MRIFLRDILVFVTILVGAYALVAAGGIDSYDSYVRGHLDKVRLAERLEGRRILIVGDSSAAFGLSAGDIERSTGVPTVNLALHGGLGAAFPLREAARLAREGDIVVLAFNWQMLATSKQGWIGALGASVLFEDPRCIRSVGPADAMRLLDGGHLALGQAFAWGMSSWKARLRGREQPPRPPYGREFFDERGDLVGHCSTERSGPLRRLAKEPLRVGDGFEAKFGEIEWFCGQLAARGVVVYRSSGVLLDAHWEIARPGVEEMQARLLAIPGLAELDAPDEAVCPLEFFFDSIAHLNCDGRAWRSARVAARLAERLAVPHDAQ